MSLETANAGEKRAWVKNNIAPILEVLAFSIHPGSSESTTTLCLMNDTVYLTSQNNLKFENIGVDTLVEKLTALRALVLDTATSKSQKFNQWWSEHCSLSRQVGMQQTASGEARAASTIMKSDEKIEKARVAAESSLKESCFDQPSAEVAGVIQQLINGIAKTKVVLDEHIFSKAPSKTGFHGESRILRFLFMKYAKLNLSRHSLGGEIRTRLDRSKGDWKGADRQELIKLVEIDFVKLARTWNLVFGSSQGTCQGCSRALDIVGAGRGPSGNMYKQWLDPLDLSGKQTGTSIAPNLAQHALNLVLVNFDNASTSSSSSSSSSSTTQ